jgi:hypothetical protein
LLVFLKVFGEKNMRGWLLWLGARREADFFAALLTIGVRGASVGMTGLVEGTEQATATADPPFDFAQGRLFGDDNQNSNCNFNGKGGAVLVRNPEGLVLGGLLRDPSLRSG